MKNLDERVAKLWKKAVKPALHTAWNISRKVHDALNYISERPARNVVLPLAAGASVLAAAQGLESYHDSNTNPLLDAIFLTPAIYALGINAAVQTASAVRRGLTGLKQKPLRFGRSKIRNAWNFMRALQQYSPAGTIITAAATTYASLQSPEWLNVSNEALRWAASGALEAAVAIPSTAATYLHLKGKRKKFSLRSNIAVIAATGLMLYALGTSTTGFFKEKLSDASARIHNRIYIGEEKEEIPLEDSLFHITGDPKGKEEYLERVSMDNMIRLMASAGVDTTNISKVERQLGDYHKNFDRIFEETFKDWSLPESIRKDFANYIKAQLMTESEWHQRTESGGFLVSRDEAYGIGQITEDWVSQLNQDLAKENPELRESLIERVGRDRRGRPIIRGRTETNGVGFDFNDVIKEPLVNLESLVVGTKFNVYRFFELMVRDKKLLTYKRGSPEYMQRISQLMSDPEMFDQLKKSLAAFANGGWPSMVRYSNRAKSFRWEDYSKMFAWNSRHRLETIPYVESTMNQMFLFDFGYPTESRNMIHLFGNSVNPKTGKRTYRCVVDIAPRVVDVPGDEVVSVYDGIVRRVDKNRNNGLFVVVEYKDPKNPENFVEGWYLHLQEVNVKEGDRVRKGQKIGEMGMSGDIDGVMLGFGLKMNGKYYVDPMMVFGELGRDQIISTFITRSGSKFSLEQSSNDYRRRVGFGEAMQSYMKRAENRLYESAQRIIWKRSIDSRIQTMSMYTQSLLKEAQRLMRENPAEAIPLLEEFTALQGGSRLDDGFLMLARAYLSKGELEKAIKAVRNGMNVCEHYKERGLSQLFYDNLSELREIESHEEVMMFSALRSLQRRAKTETQGSVLGIAEEAERVAERFFRLFPASTMSDDAYLIIGDLEEAAGKTSEAVELWQRGIKKGEKLYEMWPDSTKDRGLYIDMRENLMQRINRHSAR
ncbi:hypothetical protein D6745_05040 [Candidatus Woesearchaeota archaeon]|nr:MAG: hypothetical protein D6745_05040 [Candidatus Woesearchaeota archaeon]